jgi:hypothetical protein
MPGKSKRDGPKRRGESNPEKQMTWDDVDRELRRMGIPVVDVTEEWLRKGKTAVIMTLPPQVLPKRGKPKPT